MREANTSDINQSIIKAPVTDGYVPTIDDPDGLFPEIASKLIDAGHFSRLPFIAGTNLDEGSYTVNIRPNILYNSPSCFQELYSLPTAS